MQSFSIMTVCWFFLIVVLLPVWTVTCIWPAWYVSHIFVWVFIVGLLLVNLQLWSLGSWILASGVWGSTPAMVAYALSLASLSFCFSPELFLLPEHDEPHKLHWSLLYHCVQYLTLQMPENIQSNPDLPVWTKLNAVSFVEFRFQTIMRLQFQ